MSLFQAAVDRILSSWTVVQLAVQHGFGGVDSVAKAQWMSGALEQWLKENSNIDPSEVEDLLADILNTEFDTVADDGSLPEIAREICGCFRLHQDGKVAELEARISRLPTSSVAQSVCQGSVDDDHEEDNNQATHTANASFGSSSSNAGISGTISNASSQEQGETPMEAEDVEDDGWTVVTSKKKR